MKKTMRRLALLACLILLSVVLGNVKADAASDITTVSAAGNVQGATVSGTTDADVAAVLIEILDGSNIITLETHAVTDGTYQATLSCPLTEGKTYTVYVVNYNGTGTPQSTTFMIPISVQGIMLDKSTGVMNKIGETIQFIATVTPENASNKKVSWETSAPSVATVDADGVVTAVGNGQAVITAITEDGNKSATATVTVEVSTGDGGNTGDSGNTGDGGNAGDSGNTEDGGNTGDGGNAGDSGNTEDGGNTGDGGNAGDSGNTGDSGSTGDGGNAGDSGNTGDSGSTGDNGNTGDSGNTGNSGNSGDSGNTGESENTGDSGNTGNTGEAGNISEIVTGKDPETNTGVTTISTETDVKDGAADVSIMTEQVEEAIKQAVANKSEMLIFSVTGKDGSDVEKIHIQISKSDIRQVLDKTKTDLMVTTPAGDVIIPKDALKAAVAIAMGDTLQIEIEKVTTPNAVQKNAAGQDGCIFDVSITSMKLPIMSFDGSELKIRLLIPAMLQDKNVGIIYINRKGMAEKMDGERIKVGTKEYYEFTTNHLSTYALIDEEDKQVVRMLTKGSVFTDSETNMVYKVTKSGKTGGTVQFVRMLDTEADVVTIPDTVTIYGITYKVTAIAAYAFRMNTNITKAVIGKNVTYIGYAAFSRCTSLKSVAIGNNVTSISKWAFYRCSGLTKLTIPEKVKKIGDYAFYGCSGLTTVKLNTTYLSPETVSERAFRGVPAGAVVSVPESKLTTYKSLLVKRGLSRNVKIKAFN